MHLPVPTKIETLELVCVRFRHNGAVLGGVVYPALYFEHHLIFEKPFSRAIYSTVVHLQLLNSSETEEILRLSFLGRFRIDKADNKVDEESLYNCIRLTLKGSIHYLEKNWKTESSINLHAPLFSELKPDLTKVLKTSAVE